jgi:enoyl-CoA hydratase/carnithine racemase
MKYGGVLLIEYKFDVLQLTLNRPNEANALDSHLHTALVEALHEAAGNDRVRAVILTAAGDRTFCAGADLKEFSDIDDSAAMIRRRKLLLRTLIAILDFPKPLLCAVQNKAIGGGCLLALATDELLAADCASFRFPEIEIGMPSPVGSVLIAARSSRSVVYRLIQKGETIGADEALSIGFVDAVTSQSKLAAEALTLARVSAAHAGEAYLGNKQWINQDLRRQLCEAASAATLLQQGVTLF